MLVNPPHSVWVLRAVRCVYRGCSCCFVCVGEDRGALRVSGRCCTAVRRISGAVLPTLNPQALDQAPHVLIRQDVQGFHRLIPFSLTAAFGQFNRTQHVWSLKRLRCLLFRELSTSNRAMQYDLGRVDLVKSGHRKLLFDTHAMVQLLEDSGFTNQQAEVIMKMLVNTTNSNMDVMYSDMVTKTQQEIMLQKVMSHIAAVKKDMIILEKSEFSALLAENEKIKVELVQLRLQLCDVINKVRLDNKLDMNVEKSQVSEMKAVHEKRLLNTRNEVMEMLAEQDRHVSQSNVKIDTEVAGLKTMLESHKLDSIKYLAGSVFTCLTVVLGFYRIWM